MHKNWMHHNSESKAPLEELWNISETYKDGYQPNVEDGLTKLKARIAKEKAMPSTAKVVTLGRRRQFLRIAASVAVVLTFGFLLYWTTNDATDTGKELQRLVTTDDVLQNITLPDGSTVWVNKHSQLRYSNNFEGAYRIVELEGEAFFQVTKNAEKPFIVKTVDGDVSVLGTAFNVRTYRTETTTTVKVEEGSVAFQIDKTGQSKRLKASDKVVYNRTNATLNQIKALSWKDTAWKQQQLTFKEEPIKEVLDYLATNFDITVQYDKNRIGDCELNATLVENQPQAILKQIKSAFPLIQIKEVHSKSIEIIGSCK